MFVLALIVLFNLENCMRLRFKFMEWKLLPNHTMNRTDIYVYIFFVLSSYSYIKAITTKLNEFQQNHDLVESKDFFE